VGGLTLEVCHDSIHESFALWGDVFVIEFRQLAQKFLLTLVEFLRHFNQCLDEQVSLGAGVGIGHASASHLKYSPALRSRRDFETLATVECWDFDRCSESCLAEGNGPLQDQILAVPFEERVGFDMNEAVSIAAGASVGTRLAFSLKTNPHSVVDTGRDLHFQIDLEGFQADAIAGAAGVADRSAAAATDGARGLDAKDAGRLHNLSAALAPFAGFRLRACRGSGP